jgi:hypothetical protein
MKKAQKRKDSLLPRKLCRRRQDCNRVVLA